MRSFRHLIPPILGFFAIASLAACGVVALPGSDAIEVYQIGQRLPSNCREVSDITIADIDDPVEAEEKIVRELKNRTVVAGGNIVRIDSRQRSDQEFKGDTVYATAYLCQ